MTERKSYSLVFRFEVEEDVAEKRLDAIAEEMVAPLRKLASNLKVETLKQTFGKEIGNVRLRALQEELVIESGAASGYQGKLWEKACC
ncbi:MAG: hypothetical protein QNJ97_05755 [Myxococcota bacterium]|nr:hypothetical protein [Myxococcota bacterium]